VLESAAIVDSGALSTSSSSSSIKHQETHMHKRLLSKIIFLATICLVSLASHTGSASGLDPIIYSVRFLPEAHTAQVEVTVPTGNRASIEMMMAVWSPGFYRVEDYANRVQNLSARTAEGKPAKTDGG
jgi:hypothetical protein